MKIVSQVNADEHPSRGGVDTHVVSSVVEVFCTCVSLDVMGVVVTPAKLYINPVLLSCGTVHDVTAKDVNDYFNIKINRPFPSCLVPRFQSESWCIAFHIKTSFHSHADKTHFHMKGFAQGLALKTRHKAIRKWPIHQYYYELQ